MRPGCIVVGEVRQEECLDLLVALNSGVPGMCSVHANSAREAVTKLCTLPLLAGPERHQRVRRADGRGERRPRGAHGHRGGRSPAACGRSSPSPDGSRATSSRPRRCSRRSDGELVRTHGFPPHVGALRPGRIRPRRPARRRPGPSSVGPADGRVRRTGARARTPPGRLVDRRRPRPGGVRSGAPGPDARCACCWTRPGWHGSHRRRCWPGALGPPPSSSSCSPGSAGRCRWPSPSVASRLSLPVAVVRGRRARRRELLGSRGRTSSTT